MELSLQALGTGWKFVEVCDILWTVNWPQTWLGDPGWALNKQVISRGHKSAARQRERKPSGLNTCLARNKTNSQGEGWCWGEEYGSHWSKQEQLLCRSFQVGPATATAASSNRTISWAKTWEQRAHTGHRLASHLRILQSSARDLYLEILAFPQSEHGPLELKCLFFCLFFLGL